MKSRVYKYILTFVFLGAALVSCEPFHETEVDFTKRPSLSDLTCSNITYNGATLSLKFENDYIAPSEVLFYVSEDDAFASQSLQKKATKSNSAYVAVFDNLKQNTRYYYKVHVIYKNVEDDSSSYGTALCFETKSEVESVSLSESHIELFVDKTFELEAAVVPQNSGNTLNWYSSDTDVVMVQDGHVRAIKPGTAKITAEAGGVKSDECSVTVKERGITLSAQALSLQVGCIEQLTVEGASAVVSWTSDNTSVAKVDNNGYVTALKAGTATITAKSGSKSATCTVTVTNKAVTSVTLSLTAKTLQIGETCQLTATVQPDDATDKTVTWSSSNTSVATVDNSGEVKAVGAGTAKITAEAGGVKSAECTLTVKEPEINLNAQSLTLQVGDTKQLTAEGASGTVSWTSDNASVAKVDSKGTVTALKAGTATITAKSGSKSATCTVTVTNKAVTSVTLSSTAKTLQLGESCQLAATVKPDDATDKTVTWSSSNTSVAKVDKTGNVTAAGIGTAKITAEAGGVKSECVVTVKDKEACENLSSSGTANCYIVAEAGTYKFKATVKGNSTESVGTPKSVDVLWESFGTDVAPAVGDIIASVSLADGYVTFSTPATLANGNALIAVRNASGEIIWSWHIWVCAGYDPDAEAQVYYNNAGTMMDRNLGATSVTPGDVHAIGLFYQWGRKDPFLGPNGLTNNVNAASTVVRNSSQSSSKDGSIAKSIADPLLFIRANITNLDWTNITSESDYSRWMSTKTKYDPCPLGWKVPEGGENGVWTKALGRSVNKEAFPSDSYGFDFGEGNGESALRLGAASNIWYPAGGCLSKDSETCPGECHYVGHRGIFWSCTPHTEANYISCFLIDNVGCSAGNYFVTTNAKYMRAWGASVRCVKE